VASGATLTLQGVQRVGWTGNGEMGGNGGEIDRVTIERVCLFKRRTTCLLNLREGESPKVETRVEAGVERPKRDQKRSRGQGEEGGGSRKGRLKEEKGQNVCGFKKLFQGKKKKIEEKIMILNRESK